MNDYLGHACGVSKHVSENRTGEPLYTSRGLRCAFDS